jgi:hypothetical protein
MHRASVAVPAPDWLGSARRLRAAIHDQHAAQDYGGECGDVENHTLIIDLNPC